MVMQIPKNPSNNDIRDALIQLREELLQQFDQLEVRVDRLEVRVGKLEERVEGLEDKFEKLDYKFETYQKGTEGMVRMATTIIIAIASVVVLSSLSPAATALVTALSAAK